MANCQHVLLFVGRYNTIATARDSWFCQAPSVKRAKEVFEHERKIMEWNWGQILVIGETSDVLKESWQYDTDPELDESRLVWRKLS